jgi:hypothetical protein
MVHSSYSVTTVWSLGPDDAWAAANGYVAFAPVLHWDGVTWSVVDSPARFSAIVGKGPNDVWASGSYWNYEGPADGTLYHWDGSAWTAGSLLIQDIFDVTLSGSSAGDLWALTAGYGDEAYILHHD